MKRNYITPKAVVYSFCEQEIFTKTSGEFELIFFDDWYE